LHLSPQNPTEQRSKWLPRPHPQWLTPRVARRAFINQWNATPKPYVNHIFLVLHNSASAQAHVSDFDAYR
jgi:hypothetical protein